jgi:hypothetical protein
MGKFTKFGLYSDAELDFLLLTKIVIPADEKYLSIICKLATCERIR